MKTIFELMTSFAKDKMKKRFVLSAKGDFSKLIEDVGAEILPVEYGGTNGTVQDHVGERKQLYLFFWSLSKKNLF